MNGPARFTALAVILAGTVLSMSGCKRLEARDQLNKGVDAYKSTHYEEAIEHFQQATELDPTLPMAKSYLATALAQNVVPGMDTPDNLKTAQRAIAIFKEVLQEDPGNLNSLKQIGGIYFNIKNLDAAKEWQKKVLAVDPKDAEADYWVGMIDWAQAHQNVLSAFAATGLVDDGVGNAKAPKPLMEQIAAENAPLVAEGLEYLTQAVANRPDYDDAMAYLNLTYRRKADLDYDDPAARAQDVALADQWRAKAMDARKANEAKKNAANAGGVTMDSSGNQ